MCCVKLTIYEHLSQNIIIVFQKYLTCQTHVYVYNWADKDSLLSIIKTYSGDLRHFGHPDYAIILATINLFIKSKFTNLIVTTLYCLFITGYVQYNF